ncbi:MAG TPA: hypothetical protein VLL07_06315, partial [Pontiella sp.]|nr:hypothetical protein [Pontiella sp.]
MRRILLVTGLIICVLVFLTVLLLRDEGAGPQKPATRQSFAAENSAGVDQKIQHAAEDRVTSGQPLAEAKQTSGVSGSVLTLSDIPEGPFKAGLAALSAEDLHRVLQKLSGNRQLLSDVKSIRVDSGGMIYYVCTFGPGCECHPEASDGIAAD